MRFELSPALVEQILFAMEDQDRHTYVDTANGVVVDEDEMLGDGEAPVDDMDSRWIPLPEWHPPDGFRLMEHFAASLKNSLVRDELTRALDRGKGVFRAFKDTLSLHPEVERLWFSFKEKEIRKRIRVWYNGLLTEWGLESLGEEPEETDDLILEDFRFSVIAPEDHEVRETAVPGQRFSPSIPLVIAENARGEWAAYVAAYPERRHGGSTASDYGERAYLAIDVLPEYRGLGIGERLLVYLIPVLKELSIRSVDYELQQEFEPFARVLRREGFASISTLYRLDLFENDGESGETGA